MENHCGLNDLDFESQFANASLNPKLFTHEAHLRLAWIHISNYGVDTAIENIRKQIRYFAEAVGVQDKYNETVTIAAIYIVNHFMRKSKEVTFEKFIESNPRLKNNFKELIRTHYQTDIFTSAVAKKEYLAPELLPFD